MNLKKHEDRTPNNFYDSEQIHGQKRGVLSRYYKSYNEKDYNLNMFLFLIIILAMIYITIWFFIVDNKYDPYTTDMNDGYLIVNDYKLTVDKPRFLSYKGSLTINNVKTNDTLIIWPKLNNTYEFSFIFSDDNMQYQVYIDKHLNVIDNSWRLATEKVSERHEEINKLYSIANDYWNIDEQND